MLIPFYVDIGISDMEIVCIFLNYCIYIDHFKETKQIFL